VYWGHEFDLSGHVTAVIGHVTIRLPIGHFLLQHCHGVFNIWYITKIYFCKPRSSVFEIFKDIRTRRQCYLCHGLDSQVKDNWSRTSMPRPRLKPLPMTWIWLDPSSSHDSQ